ncbi:hypothetical protein J6U78_03800 [bacterium]|nr:hypothetical protein [bacterium]
MKITKEEARQELEQAREDLFELEISEPGSECDYLEKQQEISDARRWRPGVAAQLPDLLAVPGWVPVWPWFGLALVWS